MPGEAESNNTMGSADSISLTSGRTAAINTSSDIDWFVFSPTSSGRYRFDASDIPTGTDYDMQLYDASNNSMGSSTSGNPYETIIVNLAADTNYYLRVYSYNSSTYSSSNYCVTVTNDSCALLNWRYVFDGNPPPKNVSSGYKTRIINGEIDQHVGIDLIQCTDYSIKSATNGTVMLKGSNLNDARGYYISVLASSAQAPNSTTIATYQHMKYESPFVVNQTVNMGDALGIVGNTGFSKGDHLHFQINTNGTLSGQDWANTLNPLRFYPNINFTGDTIYSEKNALLINMDVAFSAVNEEPAAFYLLDSSLITFVGEDKFEAWLNSVDEKNCNVPGFLKYFNISDQKCIEILTKKGVNKYYGMEKVFEYRNKYKQYKEN